MEIINFSKQAPLTEKDADQMKKTIEAFRKGEPQPEGRFVILEELPKEDSF